MILLIFAFLIVGCSSSQTSTPPSPAEMSNPGEHSDVGPASLGQSSPEFLSAQQFDRYAHGLLSPDELKTLKTSCKQSPDTDRFCPSYQNASLGVKIKARQLPPRTPEIKTVKEVTVLLKNGKVKNWKKLRKEKIPSLLKAMAGFSIQEVRQIGKLALAEKRCPNGFAVVAGAELEDYLPERVKGAEIAALYEKAGHCFNSGSADRENFLTRAGLLYYQSGNLKDACRLFSTVKPADAFAGRSLYWSYRCFKESGNQAGAQAALDRLTSRYRFSFHSLVAQSSAGMDAGSSLLSEQPVALKRSVTNHGVNKLIEALELLHQFSFTESAGIFATWVLEHYKKMEPEVKVYLAELGDAPLQVTWIPQLLIGKPGLIQKETLQFAYPRAYFSLFEKQQSTVDPYLMMALARKESRFDPRAVSPTNAQGLLQIQPDTAKKLLGGATVNLLDPADNIALGSRYLSELLARLNGNLPLALAAYNAGEDPVKNWLLRYSNGDAVLFIDLIPYRETRDYVAYVLANYFWYVRSYGQPTQDPIKKLIAIAK